MAHRVIALALPALLALVAADAQAGERGADGRFDARRSAHFTLYQDVDIDHRSGPRGSRRFERDVLEALESGHARLDDLLGLRPPRRLEVMVYDPRYFDAGFGGLFPFPAAGFYRGVIRVRGDVSLSPALAATLHHELVHAALDAAAPSLVFPGWLNEGLAEWFEARALGRRGLTPGQVAALRSGASRGELAPIAALSAPGFGRMAARSAGLAYLQSQALIEELARERGDGAVRELVARVVETGDVERALARTARLGSAELEASLYASLGVAPPR